MSFRLFAYYCAICGGWAAFFGWMLGFWFLAPSLSEEQRSALVSAGKNLPSEVVQSGLRGMALGLVVAMGLSMLDAFWVFGLNRLGPIAMRVGVALFVGAVGGLLGGVLGQWLYSTWFFFYVIGWTLTGALIGASIGTFDIMVSVAKKQDVINPKRKLIKCLIGGTIGGLLGGILTLVVRWAFASPVLSWMFTGKDMDRLWTPTAVGFVVLAPASACWSPWADHSEGSLGQGGGRVSSRTRDDPGQGIDQRGPGRIVRHRPVRRCRRGTDPLHDRAKRQQLRAGGQQHSGRDVY